eukprot:TRINITY_DN1270_c0_g1_i3.p1 TRINITY_DN1270_c0_g1~~TRINITY_DN1270_c0_g1_i3.p1  ORF type:complete len:151 (-),score=25.30 TRINITY_DN1270_c0_g1_i3:11-463(-)
MGGEHNGAHGHGNGGGHGHGDGHGHEHGHGYTWNHFGKKIHDPHAAYPYPKRVWSPVGGWWPQTPKNAARNFIVASIGMAAALVYLARVSMEKERRPAKEISERLWRPVFSQRISKHTHDDDPDFDVKVERYYQRNQKSFWKRFTESNDH